MFDILPSFLVVRGVASAVCSIAGWLSVRSPMPKVSGIYACLCLREGKSFLTCCTTPPGKGWNSAKCFPCVCWRILRPWYAQNFEVVSVVSVSGTHSGMSQFLVRFKELKRDVLCQPPTMSSYIFLQDAHITNEAGNPHWWGYEDLSDLSDVVFRFCLMTMSCHIGGE
jgi:hypothetical protein